MSLNDDAPGRSRIHLREISDDAGAPLETVGQDLRAARLRRGDEIASVSRALKIRKDHLEALENDRLEDLPGKTYAIGFVRSYARHLGLDSAQYVERYKQDISGRPEEQAREPAPIHQDERRLPQGWRIIAGVIVLLLGYGAWHLFAGRSDDIRPCRPRPYWCKPSLPPPRPSRPRRFRYRPRRRRPRRMPCRPPRRKPPPRPRHLPPV
jgi:cytoskeleton protein RodZ